MKRSDSSSREASPPPPPPRERVKTFSRVFWYPSLVLLHKMERLVGFMLEFCLMACQSKIKLDPEGHGKLLTTFNTLGYIIFYMRFPSPRQNLHLLYLACVLEHELDLYAQSTEQGKQKLAEARARQKKKDSKKKDNKKKADVEEVIEHIESDETSFQMGVAKSYFTKDPFCLVLETQSLPLDETAKNFYDSWYSDTKQMKIRNHVAVLYEQPVLMKQYCISVMCWTRCWNAYLTVSLDTTHRNEEMTKRMLVEVAREYEVRFRKLLETYDFPAPFPSCYARIYLHDPDSPWMLQLSPSKMKDDKCPVIGCDVCGSPKKEPHKTLLSCGNCAHAWYCSLECQRADWKAHSKQGICQANLKLEFQVTRPEHGKIVCEYKRKTLPDILHPVGRNQLSLLEVFMMINKQTEENGIDAFLAHLADPPRDPQEVTGSPYNFEMYEEMTHKEQGVYMRRILDTPTFYHYETESWFHVNDL